MKYDIISNNMGKPAIQELGINFSAIHAHSPSPVDGSQDTLSADFIEAVKNHDCGFFEIDGIPLNFMGGMMFESEKNHDGISGLVGYDAIIVRRS